MKEYSRRTRIRIKYIHRTRVRVCLLFYLSKIKIIKSLCEIILYLISCYDFYLILHLAYQSILSDLAF